jgi:hypothetical protein
LPEPSGQDMFRVSHPVDDGDLAFVMRINKMSMFCTGNRSNSTRRGGLGTAIVDPMINLPTLNYILAGVQLQNPQTARDSLWMNLLHALDPVRFGDPNRQGPGSRDYRRNLLDLHDIVHIIQHCIRPFGVMRGSEKQGGQGEETLSPATWPVPFVGTFVLDGREDHVVNMWHMLDVNSGDDLVLHLKPMPVAKYTLNHYYKQPISRAFPPNPQHTVVWQLVPGKMAWELENYNLWENCFDIPAQIMPPQWYFYDIGVRGPHGHHVMHMPSVRMSWQELGYWHIGRTQIRLNKYVTDKSEYYHNDMANFMRYQYMLMTVQPVFDRIPFRTRETDWDQNLRTNFYALTPRYQHLGHDMADDEDKKRGAGGPRLALRLDDMCGGKKREAREDKSQALDDALFKKPAKKVKWALVKISNNTGVAAAPIESQMLTDEATAAPATGPTAPLAAAAAASAPTVAKKARAPRAVAAVSAAGATDKSDKGDKTSTVMRVNPDGTVEAVGTVSKVLKP